MNDKKSKSAASAESSSKKKETRRAQSETKGKANPLPPHYDPRDIVIVGAKLGKEGMPLAEWGPSALVVPCKGDVSPIRVLGLAVTQIASAPRWRGLINRKEKHFVFVISDAHLSDETRRTVPACFADIVGTYTETKRLVDDVRWLKLSIFYSVEQIYRIAGAELALALREIEDFKWEDALFVVWKESPDSFCGVPSLKIGEAIRDITFAAIEEARAKLDPDEDYAGA
jgi:hypothetical protein